MEVGMHLQSSENVGQRLAKCVVAVHCKLLHRHLTKWNREVE